MFKMKSLLIISLKFNKEEFVFLIVVKATKEMKRMSTKLNDTHVEPLYK